MLDDDPTDAFDLPDQLRADYVEIYRGSQNDRLPPHVQRYYAVPYVVRKEFEDGTKWYHEPADHTATKAYREAVAERADIDTSRLEYNREIPHYDLSYG